MSVLTLPELDFSAGSYKPLPLESAAQLVRAFDEGAAKARSALAGMPDEAWEQNWRLAFQGKTIFEGRRFLAYRGCLSIIWCITAPSSASTCG